jgi:DNA repair ATPase RecN
MENTSPRRSGRVGAWTLVVMGTLGLLLVLGSMAAVWALNSAVTDLLTTALSAVEGPLTRADTGLQEVLTTVDSAQTSVQDLKGTVATVGEALQADSVVLRTLGALVGTDLKNSIDKALSTLERVRSTVSTVEAVLVSVDRLPGVTLPTWVEDVGGAIDEVQQIGQKVQETVAAIESLRTGAIEQAVASVTDKAEDLETRLTNVEARVTKARTNVATLLAEVQEWKARLPGIIDVVAAVVSLFFLLMGLGQWALLSLGWSRLKTDLWIPFYPLRKKTAAAA